MRPFNLPTAVGTTLTSCPGALVAIVVVLLVGAGILLCWFGRQPKSIRKDVIRLVLAFRGK
jgi:hypothetical protein